MPNNLANATQSMDTTNLTLVTSMPARPAASLGASADPEFCPIALAPIPPVMGTDTDASRQFYRNAVSQLRMPPLPAAAKIAQGAQAATQVIYQVNGGGSNTSASSTTGVDIQVNNVDNPVQSILNLTGPGVSYGPSKGEVSIFATIGEVQNNGVAVPGEPILNFLTPIVVTDNPSNTSSDISVSDMVGDSGSGGAAGLVPAPGAGDSAAGKYLKADGTFQVPPGTGGAANYQTVESNGTPAAQEPSLNFLTPFVVTDNPGNTSTDITIAAIQAFTNKYLASPVSITGGVAAVIDSISVTFPAAGGPWYARVSYYYYQSGGRDFVACARETTTITNFAGCVGAVNNNISGISASGLSPITYANGVTRGFEVVIEDSGNSTIEIDSSGDFGLTVPSYMQVEVIAAG